MLLHDLISKLGGEAVGEVTQPLNGVGTIENAHISRITFLANPRYRAALASSCAGAVIVGPKDRDVTDKPRIVITNPYAYFARVAQLFSPARDVIAGVHPSAVIHVGAQIASTAEVSEFVSIGCGATVGEGVRIGAGCVIGENVVIGAGSVLMARVTIYADCRIGERTILHTGVVVGADGFGFAPDNGQWIKIPQTGRVVIGDDCEVGANTTIDRGAIDDTVIGNGVKIDNQVQIAHNCHVGDHTAIAGCAGMAGSARIGKRCMIGGAAMIVGHITICDDVVVSGGTLVSASIKMPGRYTGVFPSTSHRDWVQIAARLRRSIK